MAMPFLFSHSAVAEAPFDNWNGPGGKWINRMTIEFNNVYFVDGDPSDRKYEFTFKSVSNAACTSTAAYNHENGFGIDQPSPYGDAGIASEAGLRLFAPKANSADCDEITLTTVGPRGVNTSACPGKVYDYHDPDWKGCRISVGDVGARLISFFVDTDGNVKNINPGQAISFVTAPNAWNGQTVYIRSDQQSAQCKNVITKVGDQWILFSLKPDDRGSTTWSQYYDIVKTATGAGALQQDRCSNNPDAFTNVYMAALDGANPTAGGYYNIYVGTVANQGGSKAANTGSTLPGSGNTGGSAAASVKPTCEASGFSLNWILCPIYNASTSFVDKMLELVQAMLRSDDFLDPDKPMYAIWSQFRIYANIFLVIAILIAVFGQSLGMASAEALAARPFIMRLFLVVGLSNLSIYILAAYYDIINVVAAGIGAAITAPLNGAGMFKFSPTGLQGVSVSLITVGGGVAAGISGVIWGGLVGPQAAIYLALFVLLPAFFGVLSIMITLIVLRTLRLALVVSSPAWISARALPNTEHIAKKGTNAVAVTGMVAIILPAIFALCNVLSYLSITEAQSPERNIMTAKFASVVDMFMAYFFVFAPLIFGGAAFTLAGGFVNQVREFLANQGKRAHKGIMGNENDPNSVQNKARRRLGAAITQGQKDVLDRADAAKGKGIGNYWRRARGRAVGSGLFGDVTQRQSTYNAIAGKERSAKTDTGDDQEIFAGGGYMLRAGESNYDGKTYSEDKYFNSKGAEISSTLYNRGKRLHGRNSHEVGEALMYTLGKNQTEEDKAAFRYSFAKNALQQGWSEGEMMGAYAHAAYPHKRNHASVWYSTPEFERDATGKRVPGGGIVFNDVGEWQPQRDENGAIKINPSTGRPQMVHKSYDKMIDDLHKSRGSFDLSGDRHEDFQVMRKWQRELENKVMAGNAEVEDYQALGKTYEVFDAVSNRMQTMTDSEGNVSTSGASAAAQQSILDAVAERRLELSASDANGTRTFYDTTSPIAVNGSTRSGLPLTYEKGKRYTIGNGQGQIMPTNTYGDVNTAGGGAGVPQRSNMPRVVR